MDKEAMQQYLTYVSSAYKSLQRPDFGFVRRSRKSRPYEPVIRRLRDYAAVEDLVAAEDDVCFCYLLKGRASLWKLDLSMIGPFGIFVRLSNQVKESDFIHARSPDLIAFERKVLQILSEFRITTLSSKELQIEVPLSLYNTDPQKVRLYQAMFTDRNALPWEGPTSH